MKTLVSVLLLLLVLAAGAVAFIFSGIYNIAASEDHFPPVKWVLQTTMENSVKNHARGIEVPASYRNADRGEGFRHFREMCVMCHGAPGVEKEEFAKGMNPEPPELEEAADEWSPAEVWWIVEHGIKMAGMPGFGKSHAEEEIWTLAAFVKDLPNIPPEEWQRLDRTVPRRPDDHAHAGEHGGPGHGPVPEAEEGQAAQE